MKFKIGDRIRNKTWGSPQATILKLTSDEALVHYDGDLVGKNVPLSIKTLEYFELAEVMRCFICNNELSNHSTFLPHPSVLKLSGGKGCNCGECARKIAEFEDEDTRERPVRIARFIELNRRLPHKEG